MYFFEQDVLLPILAPLDQLLLLAAGFVVHTSLCLPHYNVVEPWVQYPTPCSRAERVLHNTIAVPGCQHMSHTKAHKNHMAGITGGTPRFLWTHPMRFWLQQGGLVHGFPSSEISRALVSWGVLVPGLVEGLTGRRNRIAFLGFFSAWHTQHSIGARYHSQPGLTVDALCK